MAAFAFGESLHPVPFADPSFGQGKMLGAVERVAKARPPGGNLTARVGSYWKGIRIQSV